MKALQNRLINRTELERQVFGSRSRPERFDNLSTEESNKAAKLLYEPVRAFCQEKGVEIPLGLTASEKTELKHIIRKSFDQDILTLTWINIARKLGFHELANDMQENYNFEKNKIV